MKMRRFIIATAILLSSGAAVNAQVADLGLEYWQTAEKYSEQGDKKNAFKYYKKSAKEGCARGMWLLGKCYNEGYGTSENSKEGFKWLIKAVDTDPKDEYLVSEHAANIIGGEYDKGWWLPRDYQKGAHYYRVAMETGDAWGAYKLGIDYYYGEGVVKDIKEAARLFAVAVECKYRAEEVCAKICNNRTIFYKGDLGDYSIADFPKKYPDAMYALEYARWNIIPSQWEPFSNSLKNGDPRAIAMVKKMANEGSGAARKSARMTLAKLMWTGENPKVVAQDKSAAVEYWQEFTDNAVARERLIVAHGEGIYKSDIPKEWYSDIWLSENEGAYKRLVSAANNGNYDAIIALAQSTKKAEWLDKAAQKGHKPSALMLRQLASKNDTQARDGYIAYAEKNNLCDSLYYQLLWKTQKADNMLKVAKAMDAGVNVGLTEKVVCEELAKKCYSIDDEYFPFQLRVAQLGDGNSCLRMAGLYDKAKQYEKAIEWYSKIKKKEGSDWFKLYTCYKLLGKETEAASALRTSASEGYTEARVLLGIETPKPKTVYVTTKDNSCPKCNGNGDVACHKCNGTGWNRGGFLEEEGTCKWCHGRGRIECYDCLGTGRRR